MQQRPSSDTITINCIHCGHVWQESIADLEKQDLVIYRLAEENPRQETVEYRVTCPTCGQKMIISVQVREVDDD